MAKLKVKSSHRIKKKKVKLKKRKTSTSVKANSNVITIQKPIDVKRINTCPELDEFKFYKRCPIKTCQFWTSQTERRCLAMDRRESSKGITDAELSFYKCPDLDARQVFNERRKSILRVECIIILSEFIQYIVENRKSFAVDENQFNQKVCTFIESYPLNVPDLNFAPWMLPYIVDESTYNSFLREEMNNRVDVINLSLLLDLTPRKFAAILHEINKMRLNQ